MTAAALHADVAAPARRGWRAFLWVAALTAVWAVLTYWQPGIQASGVPLTAMLMSWSVWYAVRFFRKSAEFGEAIRLLEAGAL